MKQINRSKISLVFGAVLLGLLTGCIVAPPQRVVYSAPPPVYVETVMVHGGYVYYPGYQVYYSSHSRQYVFLEGSPGLRARRRHASRWTCCLPRRRWHSISRMRRQLIMPQWSGSIRKVGNPQERNPTTGRTRNMMVMEMARATATARGTPSTTERTSALPSFQE